MRNFLRGVTEVAVHADQNRMLRTPETIQDRRAKAAILCAYDHLRPVISTLRNTFRTSILAVVIHEQHFKIQLMVQTQRVQSLKDMGNTLDFAISGYDNAHGGLYPDFGQWLHIKNNFLCTYRLPFAVH